MLQSYEINHRVSFTGKLLAQIGSEDESTEKKKETRHFTDGINSEDIMKALSKDIEIYTTFGNRWENGRRMNADG